MTRKDIVDTINIRIDDNMNSLISSITTLVAYIVLYNQRFRIDYSAYNPYDSSGEIVKSNLKFHPKDYEILGEFLEEHTGSKVATYESYRGWYYPTYSDEINTLIREYIYNMAEECFNEFMKSNYEDMCRWFELNTQYAKEYGEFFIFVEELDGDIRADYEILEKISEISFMDIYTRGELSAKRKRKQEIERETENRRLREQNKARAEMLYMKLELLYKSEFSCNFYSLGIIDKENLKTVKPFLNNHFTPEEIALLSKYKLSTSNSVALELKGSFNHI